MFRQRENNKMLQSIKDISTNIKNLAESNDDVIIEAFENIEKLSNLNVDFYRNLYNKITCIEVKKFNKFNKFNKKNNFNINKEFENAIKSSNIKNEIIENKIKNKTSKIFNRLIGLFPNKNIYRLFRMSLALTFCMVGIPNVAFATDFYTKLDSLFEGVKTVAYVIIFVFLSAELIQSGAKRDSTAIWHIMIKYIAMIIAVLSYKMIFRLIDNFFSDM